MNNSDNILNTLKRPAPITHRRLLGEARRETVEAAHLALSRSKRRKLNATEEDEDNDENDEGNEVSKPISSGALGDDDVAVFADAVYEKDDEEADMVYEQVEKRMLSRRQKQRELKLQEELQRYRQLNPTVKQQFADLKSNLNKSSEDEWQNIPDIGKYKYNLNSHLKDQFKNYTPAPIPSTNQHSQLQQQQHQSGQETYPGVQFG